MWILNISKKWTSLTRPNKQHAQKWTMNILKINLRHQTGHYHRKLAYAATKKESILPFAISMALKEITILNARQTAVFCVQKKGEIQRVKNELYVNQM